MAGGLEARDTADWKSALRAVDLRLTCGLGHCLIYTGFGGGFGGDGLEGGDD